MEEVTIRRRPLDRGAAIFRQDTDFNSLFIVRSGSMKSVRVSEDGIDQVIDFHLPGDLLGLDAISDSRYLNSAIALETTTVCELPFKRFLAVAQEHKALQHLLFRLMSHELTHDDRLSRSLTHHRAEGRLADFLLNLGKQYELRGYSRTEFNLSMIKSDIANYLGLANETVSRIFTRFRQRGVIATHGKYVKILKVATLSEVASPLGSG